MEKKGYFPLKKGGLVLNKKIDEKVEQELVDIRLELMLNIRILKFQLDLVEAVLFSKDMEAYAEEQDFY